MKTKTQPFTVDSYVNWKRNCNSLSNKIQKEVFYKYITSPTTENDFTYAYTVDDNDQPSMKVGIWFETVPTGTFGEVFPAPVPLTNKEIKELNS